jgi:hypothetical protein
MILFAPASSGPLYLVPAAGGAATPVTKLDTVRKEVAHRWPYFLPDGKHFLYFVLSSAAGASHAIYVASLDLKVNKLLLHASSNAAYASGCLLFHRYGTLVAQRFDPSALELEGDPIAVADQIYYGRTMNDLAGFAVSENGILAYRPGVRQTGSELLVFDRDGRQIGAVGEPDNYMGVRLSPDGRRLAAEILDLKSRQFNLMCGHSSLRSQQNKVGAASGRFQTPEARGRVGGAMAKSFSI